ncbi:extracellular solute-binding protein [Dinoroseobacter sp. PD6]|uniref:extracellular solute-binding protein n=1 Tax=Dinoroseobacter sp. PD6 TaxID=3028384 RepID=UPI00237B79D8|nr:extracellular solute-binding protein [Dinoroseobacter sp. PD6]MDD9715622.1 extracellular solute-binding protein [Dinoroseobacter sp. PD6]
MKQLRRAIRIGHAALIAGFLAVPGALAAPSHGIAMYGDPALPPDFVSLPYANPDAPKGGRIVLGEVGGFDSLNPHILKGRVPWQLRFLAHESLMARNYDEPFALYGLLAESLEVDPDGLWVAFTLRPEARFSDGSPVTVEDVLWSFETLGTVGHPRYLGAWAQVQSAEATGPRSLRITFTEPNRELALIMGMRPILKKAQWEGKDFAESGLDEAPISSAPYVIADFEPGRFVTLRRNPDYWAADLPIRRGVHNLDEIRMEFFGDAGVMFEAFKAGILTSIRETNTAKWNRDYDFPAVQAGEVVKSVIPHERPSGITGFAMNTRRADFADWRVRDALIHAFNFELINRTLNGGEVPRITSYFSNSVLAMQDGPATGRVVELLAPYADTLPPGALEGYTLPVSDGSEANRRNIRAALRLMDEAGYTIEEGVMTRPDGTPFTFEILLSQGSSEVQSMINIYAKSLERLGVSVDITTVDSAQYRERTDAYDFDMTYYTRGLSLSPGNEQRLYWGSEGVDIPGSRNWPGIDSAAVDGLIDAMLSAESQEDYIATVRALDRVLTAGRYVIPIWFNPVSRIAHAADLTYPEALPAYGDWISFHPDVWWSKSAE